MQMDFEPTVDKIQTMAIHDFIEDQISKKLNQLWQRQPKQQLFQIMATLNELIAFDNTYGHYLQVCAQLSVACRELELEDVLIQNIAQRFGADCFFLACFLQRPTNNPAS